MRMVHPGSGLLVVAVAVAAMVTLLIVTGHGSEAPLVVGSVSMVLGPFIGNSPRGRGKRHICSQDNDQEASHRRGRGRDDR
jgi:hypothetical protein